jgi:invasion protein IalB
MTYAYAFARRLIKLAVLAAVLCFSGGIAGWAQSAEQSSPLPPDAQQRREESPWEVQQRRAAAKQQNLKRQHDLKKDTDKLLELATQLKQEVDKTNENTLSLEVIKKAAEIEKLARSVKEKMKGE